LILNQIKNSRQRRLRDWYTPRRISDMT
jgi:hypothetical protein